MPLWTEQTVGLATAPRWADRPACRCSCSTSLATAYYRPLPNSAEIARVPRVKKSRGRALLAPSLAQHTEVVRTPGFLSADDIALIREVALRQRNERAQRLRSEARHLLVRHLRVKSC